MRRPRSHRTRVGGCRLLPQSAANEDEEHPTRETIQGSPGSGKWQSPLLGRWWSLACSKPSRGRIPRDLRVARYEVSASPEIVHPTYSRAGRSCAKICAWTQLGKISRGQSRRWFVQLRCATSSARESASPAPLGHSRIQSPVERRLRAKAAAFSVGPVSRPCQDPNLRTAEIRTRNPFRSRVR